MSQDVRSTRYFSSWQLRGLSKAGDLLIPGDQDWPKFSETPFVYQIDRLADTMTDSDRQGFGLLMGLFSGIPRFLARLILNWADSAEKAPALIRAPLNLINFGVKGVVYSLYYSDLTADQSVRARLNWNTRCGEDTELPVDPAQRAFQVARAAARGLRQVPVSQRVRMLSRLKQVILDERDAILDQLQTETGKSRSDALMSELFPILDHLDYLVKTAPGILADRKVASPLALLGRKSRIYFEPLGPVLVICPWNYPFYQALVPATLAIVCGNPVVYKPSELTPLQGLVEKLWRQARLPSEWLQIVYGDGRVGEALIEEKPAKIFFIGSSKTGQKIAEKAARHLIPVELELGGKDPMVVFEDVQLDRAVAGALWGACTNSGQSCTSVERLYVQEALYESFKEKLLKEVSLLTLGVDRDGSKDLGRMTSQAQVAIIAEQIQDVLGKWATLLSGREWDRKSPAVPVIVVEGVTPEMKLYREETFGPVIPLIPFRTEEDVVRMANDSEYGLSASVWSADLRRAERVARSLEVGNVSINNVMLTEANSALPFGGVKKSGYGRYKGEFGFYAFANIKSVLFDSNSKKIEANWYPFTTPKYRVFSQMMQGLFSTQLKGLLQFALRGLQLESLAQKNRVRQEESE